MVLTGVGALRAWRGHGAQPDPRSAKGHALVACYRWWSRGFVFVFLNELFPPRRRDMAEAGASTFGASLAAERQAALNIALALTDWAFSECHLSHRLV